MVEITEGEKRALEGKALERYEKIVGILRQREDRTGLVLVNELIEKCVAYFELLSIIAANRETIFKSEVRRMRSQLPEIPRERLIAAEETRLITHNEVIWKIEEVNAYLFRTYGEEGNGVLIPRGGIYSQNPIHVEYEGGNLIKYRTDIANWVIYLVNALYRRGLISK